jgi:hypothetical protein
MQAYEKLGAFYLGRRWDAAGACITDDLVLYDAKDLTTHAVCVGMTGSGKTGLCLALLEEAAIDGIPAIAIDPKGDVGNLLLTFPALAPQDFEPWVSADEAARKGRTIPEQAQETADAWRRGLAEWGQDGERIARMRAAAEFCIYTPGSTAGRPLSLLRSLVAPPAALRNDGDALRERVLATVSGLMTLVGLEPDPVRSREHILLATLLDQAWRSGRSLELAELIRLVQKPPFDRVGVLDLETFFPAADRFTLALTFNNVLASPGFAAWMEGEPLDVQRLLWTPAGRPRVAILSIAHLSDAERMFFVTMLLNEVVAWMRMQPGSGSLRALLYMDEVFGFFPPVANPPSKPPMLTLLKQARAFGLGVMLATQNPVDLDYKGLSNAGTWFLGRLQTERDKQRVLDGLEGAATTGFDRARADATLSALPGRVFLLHDVHEDGPVLLHTRWAMSYLRGPMTREEIRRLTPAAEPSPATAASPVQASPAPAPAGPESVAQRPASSAGSSATRAAGGGAARGGQRVLLPADVHEHFVPATRDAPGDREYRPALLGRVRLHFTDARRALDEWRDAAWLALLTATASTDVWVDADRIEGDGPVLGTEPAAGCTFAALPATAGRAPTWKAWQKALADHAYRSETLTRWQCRSLDRMSEPGESEGDFRIRLTQHAREQRDAAIDKLRQRFAARARAIEQRRRSAEERIAREQAQYSQQKMQTAISFGATVLGAMFGRRTGAGTIGRAASAARGAGRIGDQRDDVSRAQDSLEGILAEQRELERQIEDETSRMQSEYDPVSLVLEPIEVRPRKTDIDAAPPLLVWLPYAVGSQGSAQPLA